MTTVSAGVISAAQHLEFVAADVARMGAALVRESVGKAAATHTKTTSTDVVTHTDVESERLIRTELLTRCPGSTIVGEEMEDDVGETRIGWIVDPIDGTVNFLYDLPVVSVSIAATIDGEVVAGAVTDVLRDETFTAARGAGATRDGQSIQVNPVDDLNQALIGTGFAYDAAVRAVEADILTRLLPASRDIRCMGSAALNLCWVGCGRLDGFYERDIQIYDYAAGALVAREAGAKVELPAANDSDLTIAASPGVYSALHHVVADAGSSAARIARSSSGP